MDDANQHRELIVLHRLYGAVKCVASPDLRKALSGDLVQIATMTDAAERAREDLACTRGLERESVVRLHCVAPAVKMTAEIARLTEEWAQLARTRMEMAASAANGALALERLNARRQRLQERLDDGTVHDEAREKLKVRLRRLEALCAESASARAARLARRLRKVDAEIDACGEALDRHAGGFNESAAVVTTYASADRETSHDEALEWALKGLKHRNDERNVWLGELARQCRELQRGALAAYREARAST
jgi:hypothetical protein